MSSLISLIRSLECGRASATLNQILPSILFVIYVPGYCSTNSNYDAEAAIRWKFHNPDLHHHPHVVVMT